MEDPLHSTEPGPATRAFPMMTMPLDTFFGMTRVQPHEELQDSLVEFDEKMGKAMFVSHQWVTSKHPDPDFIQVKVLQEALQNIVSGRSRVSISVQVEIAYGRVKRPVAADFSALYLWYDYFSCPQGSGKEATAHRSCAISCIPAYVAKCVFCAILCPSLHFNGRTFSYSTWAARGWCRLEQLASELALKNGYVIIIKTPDHPTLVFNAGGLCRPPGTGNFSIESDRQQVGQVVSQLLWKKLDALLGMGKLEEYRFLLNLQAFYLKRFDQQPLEGLVPGFHTEIDVSEGDAFLAARFLHDNHFGHIRERDKEGWSPLCYAVLTGKCALVRALLKSRADANECTTKSSKSRVVEKQTPVLSLAAMYHSNEVMTLLLEAGANVNALSGNSSTVLHFLGVADNASGVNILLEARADPSLMSSIIGISPFKVACATGSVGVMKEMLRLIPEKVSLKLALHFALAFNGDSDTISCLLDASADVNERLRIFKSRSGSWAAMRAFRAMHFVSPSALTLLASHHSGATPLIFSILTGKFEIIPILLAAGARVDLPNARGKTPADFLQQMHMPLPWNGDSEYDSDGTLSIPPADEHVRGTLG